MPGNKLQVGEMSGYQADAFHVCRRVSAGHQWPRPSLEMTDRENKTNTNSEHEGRRKNTGRHKGLFKC